MPCEIQPVGCQDVVVNVGVQSDSFKTIAVPAGTNPVADSATDTLTFTSTGGTVTITGDATTDTINFEAAAAGASDAAWTNIVTTLNNDVPIGTKAFRIAASGTIITGVAAQSDGTEIIIHNASNASANLSHNNSGSTAVNRFSNPGSSNISLFPGQAVRYKYSTAVSRWVMSAISQVNVTAPLTMNSALQISLAQASSSSNGFLSSTDWTTFNGKLTGTGTATNIAYFSATNVASSDNDKLVWNATKDRLGVQIPAANCNAAMHLVSQTAEAVATPVTFTATLAQFNAITEPSSSAAPTQVAGRLMNPDSPTAVENSSAVSPFAGGDTFEYRISAYYDDSGTYTECAQYTDTPSVTLVSSGNGVNLTWTNDNTGSLTRTGYILYRNYNGSGFTEYLDVGNVTAYNDDGQDTWAIGSYPANFVYGDYIADGTSRDYEYYSKATIGPGPYFSELFEVPTTFTDDNSGKPFGVEHNINSPEANARIIGSPTGSGGGYDYDVATGVSVIEYSDSWVSGGSALPNSVGYTSDGSTLTRDYEAYKYLILAGNTAYSTAVNASTTDPDDGNTYYVIIEATWATPSNGVKFIDVASNNGKVVSGGLSATIYDTANAYGNDFPDSNVVTPTGFVPAALIVEKAGNANSPAWVTVKGTAGYSRVDFVNSSDTVQGQISSSAGEISIGHSGSVNIRANSTQLGFYNVTPVSRATTSGTAATFVANTSGIADDSATFDGYTIGQIIRALRNVGILT